MEALTPGEARSRQFRFARKGYDPLDVADFVDEVCQTLAMHVANEVSLTEQLEAARRRISEVQSENESSAGSAQQMQEAARAELASERSRMLEEIAAERARLNQEAEQAQAGWAAQLESEREQFAQERASWQAQVDGLNQKLSEFTTPPPAPDITPTAMALLRTAQETAQKVIDEAEATAREIIDETNSDLISTQERIASLREKEDHYRNLLLGILEDIKAMVADPTAEYSGLDASGDPYVSPRLGAATAPGVAGEGVGQNQGAAELVEQTGEPVAEQVVEQAAENPYSVNYGTEQAAEQPVEQPVEQPAENPYSVNYGTEQPVENPYSVNYGTEQAAEQPVENPYSVSYGTEQAAEQAVENPYSVNYGGAVNTGGIAAAAANYLGTPSTPAQAEDNQEAPVEQQEQQPQEEPYNPHPWGS